MILLARDDTTLDAQSRVYENPLLLNIASVGETSGIRHGSTTLCVFLGTPKGKN